MNKHKLCARILAWKVKLLFLSFSMSKYFIAIGDVHTFYSRPAKKKPCTFIENYTMEVWSEILSTWCEWLCSVLKQKCVGIRVKWNEKKCMYKKECEQKQFKICVSLKWKWNAKKCKGLNIKVTVVFSL